MSTTYAIAISIAACVLAAGLESVLAGKNVKAFLSGLRAPSYSPSLLVWSLIGAGYYLVCFTLLYRLLRYEGDSVGATTALLLLVTVMALNAFWNYTFFRMKNLGLSFFLFVIYGIAAVGLLICLIIVDRTGAVVLLPYLIYMIYAYRWGYGVWKLNDVRA